MKKQEEYDILERFLIGGIWMSGLVSIVLILLVIWPKISEWMGGQ